MGKFWRRDGTVGVGVVDETGRYGQLLTTELDGREVSWTGRDGRGRLCRRDGTVRGSFFDGTGRQSATGEIFWTRRGGTN